MDKREKVRIIIEGDTRLTPEILAVFEVFLDSMPERIYQELIEQDKDHWVEYFLMWCAQMESLSIESADKH